MEKEGARKVPLLNEELLATSGRETLFYVCGPWQVDHAPVDFPTPHLYVQLKLDSLGYFLRGHEVG